MLIASGLGFSFGPTGVLSGLDLKVEPRESLGIEGKSGCGKTTLLHILAGLIVPTAGEVRFEEVTVSALKASDRARLRLSKFGFVFQSGGLVPEMTAVQNVELPLLLLGTRADSARRKAMTLLEEFEVGDHADKRTSQISGGQYQRIAVARALVHDPQVIFADEPTGSLDEESAEPVLDALLAAVRSRSASLVMVSHDHHVLAQTDRVVRLRHGTLA